MLKRLWLDQKGRCALTGDVLQPGVNASLDHIVPRSKDGQSIAKNLQWVLLSVNVAKQELDVVEFVELCRKITSHASERLNIIANNEIEGVH